MSYLQRAEHVRADMSEQEFSGFEVLCEHMTAKAPEP